MKTHLFFFVTGANLPGDLESQCYQIGGFDYIRKPIRPLILQKKLQKNSRYRNPKTGFVFRNRKNESTIC